MKYHWEELEDGSICLFEDGTAPKKFNPMPGLASQIIGYPEYHVESTLAIVSLDFRRVCKS
jgi:hypothetical protein